MVLVAVINLLLHRFTGQEDIWIGALVPNRHSPKLQESIGYFVNTVILRNDVFPHMTIRDLLENVRRVTIEALAHEQLPFELLARVMEKDKCVDRSALFSVLLSYRNAVAKPVTRTGITIAALGVHELGIATISTPTALDLIYDMTESSTKLTVSVNYRNDVFTDDLANCLTGSFETMVEAITHRPDSLVRDV
jgi:non-ribosomal peptide synthetase component F